VPANETVRRPSDIAGLIEQELEDAPEWLDLTDDPDAAMAFLLDEGRSHHVPRELLWEYAASRWTELFQAAEERRESD
jgi:hypothetical protein